MTDQKMALFSGALLGLTAVIAGAFGAHALENRLAPDALDAYETAVRFQFFHALLLMFLGILVGNHPHTALRLGIRSALIGILMFSGSIYFLTLTPLKPGILTPIGGVFLILAWGALLWWTLRHKGL